MHLSDPAVQLLGMNPVVAAAAGYTARRGVASVLRRSPYAALLGRFTAALIWGGGGVATLTAVGVPVAVTVPLALTVLTVVVAVLVLAYAGGLLRQVPVGSSLPTGT
ncbi:hypothetical protein [Nocardia rhizosphaerae]|uniref:Uncharacterized protein n=1 Tax=Nocardia rhizosphaerae TaxID=1691571 RepID=A0ABV8L5I0_9NOCA